MLLAIILYVWSWFLSGQLSIEEYGDDYANFQFFAQISTTPSPRGLDCWAKYWKDIHDSNVQYTLDHNQAAKDRRNDAAKDRRNACLRNAGAPLPVIPPPRPWTPPFIPPRKQIPSNEMTEE